jgi:pilus assembly protein Flp/PilA
MRQLITLLRDRRGATAIEYAAIASLISVAAIAAFNGLGDKVDGKFGAVNQALSQNI